MAIPDQEEATNRQKFIKTRKGKKQQLQQIEMYPHLHPRHP